MQTAKFALLCLGVLMVALAAKQAESKHTSKTPASTRPAASAPAPSTATSKAPAGQSAYIWTLRFDEDGDFSVLQVEWLQGWGMTSVALDSDSNGFLSPSELNDANDEALKLLDRGFRLFIARLDWNKDAVLSKKEWQGYLDEYIALDANGDGNLTTAEIVSGERKHVTDHSMPATPDQMEAHIDGRISSDEWLEAALKLFKKLDRNHNNRLDAADFS
ncbi:MAG: hypothetical protein ACREJQ_08830 [bacterium]